MGNKFLKRVVLQIARHLPHAGAVSGRFFAADAENTGVFGAEMAMGTERDFAEVRKISGFDEKSADAQHFEGFGDGLGNSSGFDDHIGAAAVGEIFDDFQALSF